VAIAELRARTHTEDRLASPSRKSAASRLCVSVSQTIDAKSRVICYANLNLSTLTAHSALCTMRLASVAVLLALSCQAVAFASNVNVQLEEVFATAVLPEEAEQTARQNNRTRSALAHAIGWRLCGVCPAGAPKDRKKQTIGIHTESAPLATQCHMTGRGVAPSQRASAPVVP
jgi:hypothetical protein